MFSAEEAKTIDCLLWGKSKRFKRLSAHMIDAGACAKAYLSYPSMAGSLKRLSELTGLSAEAALNFAAYIVSMHDICKAHPIFQKSDAELAAKWLDYNSDIFPATQKGAYRHERELIRVLRDIWTGSGELDTGVIDTLLAALSLHHQGKKDDAMRPPCKGFWADAQIWLEARMRALFCPDMPVLRVKHQGALGVYLTGFIILCDWVASSSAFDDMGACENDEAYCARALDKARGTLRGYALTNAAPPRVNSFSELWKAIPLSSMRPLQVTGAQIADGWGARPPLLTIIEDVMGEGKTELAMYMALKLIDTMGLAGFYMGLPTAATSNQMYDRIKAMMDSLGTGGVRLLHGMAWLRDEASPDATDFDLDADAPAAEWLAPMRRGMLAASAVGTVDQAMSSVLLRKYSLLRLTGLFSKVLIIDEIHAYDAYMSKIIERLLEWCAALKIPVILLSATMHEKQKRKYMKCFGAEVKLESAYPLITEVFEGGGARQTPINDVFQKSRYALTVFEAMNQPEAIAKRAIKRVEHGGRLCVLMNTVDGARAVYEALKRLRADGIMLFHARFEQRYRNQIEKRCVDKFGKAAEAIEGERLILVCTQVVEQSLDVDFDGMITELAPIDLILQRAGRVHRHRRARPRGFERPIIEIILPSPDAPAIGARRYMPSSAVYDPYILAKTESLVRITPIIALPEDMRRVIEDIYSELSDARIEEFIKLNVKERLMEIEGEANLIPEPEYDGFFATASVERAAFELADEETLFGDSASTRLGGNTARVAFLDEALYAAAISNKPDRELMKKILLCSCNLRLTGSMSCDRVFLKDKDNLLKANSRLIYLKSVNGVAQINGTRIISDPELGVYLEV